MTEPTPNGLVDPVVLYLTYLAFMTSCCGYALFRGGKPERIGAGIVIVASFFTSDLAPHGLGWAGASMNLVLIDSLTMSAVTVLALTSNRYWPMWFAGFCLVGLMTHVAAAAMPEFAPKAYSLSQGFWAYPAIGAMALGTWSHRRTMNATPSVA